MAAGIESLFDGAALILPLASTPLFLLGVLLLRGSASLRRLVGSDAFIGAALVAGALVGLLFAGQVATYLAYPGFPDHVQTTIAKMAFLLYRGQDLYPPPGGPAIYGMPYGPSLFLLDGIGTGLDPSNTGAKIPAVAALVLGLFGLLAALRATLDGRQATLLTLLAVMLLLPYGLFAYWNRPEPFLFSAAALAFAALRLRPVGAAVAIGLLLGLAAGIKLHGFLYLAPAAAALIGQRPGMRAGVTSLLTMGLAALAAFAAPFLLPNVSVAGYARDFAMAAGHGLDRVMLLTSLELAAAILAPALLLYVSHRPPIDAADRWLFWGLLAAATGVVLVAGRVQAGAYHVLALIPACLYTAARLATGRPSGRALPVGPANLWAFGLLLALVAFWPGLLRNYGGISTVELLDDRAVMGEAMNELHDYAERYPGAQMAVSDDDRYWLAMQDAPLVFRSGRLVIDYASWMDLVFIGAGRDGLVRFVEDCPVPAWVMPEGGGPFTLHSLYDGASLFTDEFRRRFLDEYREAESGRFYRVWICRKG